MGETLKRISPKISKHVTQKEKNARAQVKEYIVHNTIPANRDMEEIQKVFQKNKKLVEEAQEEAKMSIILTTVMEERAGIMTMRLYGDAEPPGGLPMTSTPQKVKRGFDSINEGGGGVLENKSPRQKSPPVKGFSNF